MVGMARPVETRRREQLEVMAVQGEMAVMVAREDSVQMAETAAQAGAEAMASSIHK
jgi:hypothetical protein